MKDNKIIIYKDVNADPDLVSLAEEKLYTKAVTEIPESVSEDILKKNVAAGEPAAKKQARADEKDETTPILAINSDGISLIIGDQKIRGDFSKEIPRVKNESRLNGELLIKAAKIRTKGTNVNHELTAIDATAGLGEDAFLLAAYGYKVTMYERDPVVGLLLYDALCRARKIPELKDIVSRMELKMENSILAMLNFAKQNTTNTEKLGVLDAPCVQKTDKIDAAEILSQTKHSVLSRPDIILLDPMFPERKKSGLIKKKFQILHYLEEPCADEAELLDAAKAVHPKKIIIKRPAKGPYLADEKPSYSIKGDSIRYDCLTLF